MLSIALIFVFINANDCIVFRPLKSSTNSPGNRYGTGTGAQHSPKIYRNDLIDNSYPNDKLSTNFDPYTYRDGRTGATAGTSRDDMIYDSRRRLHSTTGDTEYGTTASRGTGPQAQRIGRMRQSDYNYQSQTGTGTATGGSNATAYNASYSQQNGCNITSNIGM